MRITIVTVGTRGDVEPFVALGVGLQKSGHSVKIATHAMFESFITENGLGFALVSGNVQEAINSDEAREALEGSKTSFSFLLKVRSKAAPLVLTAVKELFEACKDAEHLMCTPLTLHITYFLSKEFSIPISVGCVNPAGPTRHFHCIIVPPAPESLPVIVKRVYNAYSHVIMGKLVWMGQRPLLNEAWKKVFGHGLPINEPLGPAFKKNPRLMLYAYSRHVLDKPADWASVQHVTGYWFLKPDAQQKLTPELEKFIHAGSKPIYIGFGSMNSGQHKKGAIKKLILEAVSKTGQRAVVLNTGLDLVPEELPENIFATAPVPFELLFPKMAAVVHHGGAGTTAAGLRAGVPSVITPLIYDQRFWAWCVEKNGTGTRPIPWSQLTADNLCKGIMEALYSKEIEQRAHETGKAINSEDGVEQAVKLFNQFYK